LEVVAVITRDSMSKNPSRLALALRQRISVAFLNSGTKSEIMSPINQQPLSEATRSLLARDTTRANMEMKSR
jgi:hypothetical protein